jgi:hypothetical protein
LFSKHEALFSKDEDHPSVRSTDPHFLRLVRARKTACKVWKSFFAEQVWLVEKLSEGGAIDRADSVAITFVAITFNGVTDPESGEEEPD